MFCSYSPQQLAAVRLLHPGWKQWSCLGADANPYERHLFQPALQVAQRALSFQATGAVLASLPIASQCSSSCDGGGLWYRKQTGVIRWLLKHPACSRAVSRTLL